MLVLLTYLFAVYLCRSSQRWVRFGKDLELLDSPGIIPMRISDQSAAIKLAICDDIGEKSYDFVDVAAILVQMLTKLPSVGIYSMMPKLYLLINYHGSNSNLQFHKRVKYTFGYVS